MTGMLETEDGETMINISDFDEVLERRLLEALKNALAKGEKVYANDFFQRVLGDMLTWRDINIILHDAIMEKLGTICYDESHGIAEYFERGKGQYFKTKAKQEARA
jgi:hypothetical protein